MTIIQLYKKGSTIGPVETEGSVPYGKRLVADEGKVLKNTETEDLAYVIDVYDGHIEKWEEIDDEQPEEEISYEEIGKILTGDDE